MSLPRWLERSLYGVVAAGLVAGALQVQGCRHRREIQELVKAVNAQHEARARADQDRIQQLVGDSLELTRRLVSTESSQDSLRGMVRHLAGALEAKSRIVAALNQEIAYRDSLAETQGLVEAMGDTLWRANFHHQSQVLDATTQMTLHRLGMTGTSFTAGEQLTIDRLRLPLETALVMLEDGSIEAQSTCPTPGCQVRNLNVPILWVSDLVHQLEVKHRLPVRTSDSGGIGPVGYLAIGGGVVGAGVLVLGLLTN